MCALALSNFIWNGYAGAPQKEYRMRVEYRQHEGNFRRLYYRLFAVEVSPDNRQLQVNIIRDGGGIDCRITVRRASTSEGSELTMTHGEQHTAGLEEIFNLYKGKISNGMHRNSKLYREFSGEVFSREDYKKMWLFTDVKKADGSFVKIRYMLEFL